MGKRGPAEIEEALARGHHVALIGTGSLDAASLGDLTIVRISAAGADATLGPLAAARRELQRLLGRDRPEAAGARPHLGSPRRGLEWPSIAEAALVEVGNALIDRTAGRAALMLDHAESIDEATAASLLDILSRPGWLRLPLVLSFEAARGAHLGALLSRLRGLEGVQVLELEGAKAAASDLASLPNEARGRVLRVLRAAAIVGIPFEISSVAFLLDAEPVSVLEALQEAADAGFPIADGGDGRFVLPQEAAQALRARLLPSLGAFWHRRLAVLHGQLEAGPARRGGASGGAAARAPAPSRAPAAGPDAIGAPLPAPARARTSASATGERQEITPPAYPELFDRREELGSEPSPALPILQPSIASPGARAGAPPASQPPGSRLDADPEAAELPRVSPPPSKDSPAEKARIGPGERPDPARAAAHHAAAGELGRAIDQFLVAAEAAELARDARRAQMLAQRALELVESQPGADSDRGRVRRARALGILGRIRWRGATMGEGFTLQDALAIVESALETLPPDSDPALLASLSRSLAGICYDIGDAKRLERGLEVLTASTRTLTEAAHARLAASLLTEMAAIYVRLGDPVRGAHLLTRSRDIFEEASHGPHPDRTAIAEAAESDHLLARLPLHAGIRAGREAEAYARALEHAEAAARAYQRLEDGLELGRVWETMGRLLLEAGNIEEASTRLGEAFEQQRELGDIMGLARTAGALAELLLVEGRPLDALELLRESVELNLRKGSPLGLAFNRRALGQIGSRIEGDGRERQTFETLEALDRRIAEGEALLGRASLRDALD